MSRLFPGVITSDREQMATELSPTIVLALELHASFCTISAHDGDRTKAHCFAKYYRQAEYHVEQLALYGWRLTNE